MQNLLSIFQLSNFVFFHFSFPSFKFIQLRFLHQLLLNIMVFFFFFEKQILRLVVQNFNFFSSNFLIKKNPIIDRNFSIFLYIKLMEVDREVLIG